MFAKLLVKYECKNLLDPMAGTGKILLVREHGWDGPVYLNELEQEWRDYDGHNSTWTFRDAKKLPYPNGAFDAIITSPTYGNRMADHHKARDGSDRITYRHRLGRELHPANTGQLQWGLDYRLAHGAIWAEAARLLRPKGILVVNVSDFFRDGLVVPVSAWHVEAIERLGLACVETHEVKTRRMRKGQNSEARVEFENVFVFQRRNA